MLTALIAFIIAGNPASALSALGQDWRTDRPIPVLAGALAAVGTLVGLAAASEQILELLAVNLGTYRVGAGVVVALAGLRWLLLGSPKPAEEPATDFRLGGYIFFPTLITPAVAVLAVAIGAEDGTAVAAVGAAVTVILGAAAVYQRRRVPFALGGALVRVVGAGGVVVGVGLVVDGIKTL